MDATGCSADECYYAILIIVRQSVFGFVLFLQQLKMSLA